MWTIIEPLTVTELKMSDKYFEDKMWLKVIIMTNSSIMKWIALQLLKY